MTIRKHKHIQYYLHRTNITPDIQLGSDVHHRERRKINIITVNSFQAERQPEQGTNIENKKKKRNERKKNRKIIGAQQTSEVFHNTDSVLKSLPHQSPIKLLQSIID